ncbi:hypothetical protein TNCV_2519721 [Trichonephila clavipes]|nr:hypothetical protein TNCV_2519721 [Trichonephila clavipes]
MMFQVVFSKNWEIRVNCQLATYEDRANAQAYRRTPSLLFQSKGGSRVELVGKTVREKLQGKVAHNPYQLSMAQITRSIANSILVALWGCGSPVVKVSDHGRHVVMSSSPVPLKTHRIGQ